MVNSAYVESISNFIKREISKDPHLDGLRDDFSVFVYEDPLRKCFDINFYGRKDKFSYSAPYSINTLTNDVDGKVLKTIIRRVIIKYLENRKDRNSLGLTISQEDYDNLHLMDDVINQAKRAYMSQFEKKLEETKKEEKEMKETRTESEVKFAQALDEINQKKERAIAKAKAEAERATAEEKEKLDLAQLREKNKMGALDCRYFFEELVASGFNDDQAMQILLTRLR